MAENITEALNFKIVADASGFYGELAKTASESEKFISKVSGTQEKVESQTNAGKKVPLRAIVDEQGREITQPVPLDGKGKKLPEGADPNWFWHRKRYEADLNLLRIPNPFLV